MKKRFDYIKWYEKATGKTFLQGLTDLFNDDWFKPPPPTRKGNTVTFTRFGYPVKENKK